MKACPEGFSTVGQLIAQRAVVRLAAALVAQRRLAVLLPRSTGQLRCTGGRALVTWLWRAAVVHGRAGRDHRRAGVGGRAAWVVWFLAAWRVGWAWAVRSAWLAAAAVCR